MTCFYNEIDPYAAQWLRNLIAAGHIAPGVVDERSIADIEPGELMGYRQCHFFAGIGVWSYALRLAGWSDDRQVWTGSCPCQPFSAAGRSGGFDDERHLWPHWMRLIRECKPGVVFGEQVASADGLAWLDFVCADMEAAGYAIGPVDTCSAGFGAPHIRQRLWFVADANGGNASAEGIQRGGQHGQQPQDGCARGGLGDADSIARQQGHQDHGRRDTGSDAQSRAGLGGASDACIVAYAGREAPSEFRRKRIEPSGLAEASVSSFWSDAEWIYCRDDKWRPVGPGSFPLAHGAPSRMGRLRAYGNCINAEAAKEFVMAYAAGREA